MFFKAESTTSTAYSQVSNDSLSLLGLTCVRYNKARARRKTIRHFDGEGARVMEAYR